MEHQVQPEQSPYYMKLPCRALIPFTNISIGVANEEIAAALKPSGNPTKRIQRTAGECAKAMETAYETWGFVVLRPLTGLSVAEADLIFQTVHPERYKLKDIVEALENADERIDDSELTDEQKGIAYKVRDILIGAASVAVRKGEDVMEHTIESMNSRFSGGAGKVKADPHDKYIFNEFERDIPKLVDTGKKDEGSLIAQLAQVFQQPKVDNDLIARLEAKEKELDQTLAEAREEKERISQAYRDRFKKKEVTEAATV
jgi:hypothetical protein